MARSVGKRIAVRAAGNNLPVTRKGRYKEAQNGANARAGERFLLQTAGGGGYGEPAKRAREAALRDITEGCVSKGAAANLYGGDKDCDEPR